jgi:phosphopantothenoylcysteine decarboxylase/phosphopantothenate--cysteine ligase
MRRAVWRALDRADVLLMAAAVADYRPRTVAEQKLKKSAGELTLELVPTVDILESLRVHPRRTRMLLVGFAAETDDLLANAAEKLRRKGLDLIVLNDVGAPGIGMGADDNAVTILDRDGVVLTVGRSPKLEVGRRLVALVAARLPAARRADRPRLSPPRVVPECGAAGAATRTHRSAAAPGPGPPTPAPRARRSR